MSIFKSRISVVLAVAAFAVGSIVFSIIPATAFADSSSTPATSTLTVFTTINNNSSTAFTPGEVGMIIQNNSTTIANGDPGNTSGATYILNSGSYNVSGSTVDGQMPEGTGNCSGTTAGDENLTCTLSLDFTDRLEVAVDVNNLLGGSAVPSDFTVTVGGSADAAPATFAGSAGTLITITPGATYTINASPLANYTATQSGACSALVNAVDACTITETYTPSETSTSSTVDIFVVVNGGTAQPSDFTATVTGDGVNANPAAFPGSASGTMVTLNAGSFPTFRVTSLQNYSPSATGHCTLPTVSGPNTCTQIINTETYDGPATSTPTSTLTINMNDIGGSAQLSDFQLNGSSAGVATLVNGVPGLPTLSFTIDQGVPFNITEATDTNSANYAIGLNGCSGTIGSSPATCNITNTFIDASSTGNSTSTVATSTTPVESTSTTNPDNLILNPLLTATTTGLFAPDPTVVPTDWSATDWGDAAAASTTFTFPVSGWTAAGGTGNGINVTIANYPSDNTGGNSGDAKWAFDNVPVTPGAGYTFSDEYISNTSSIMLAAFDNGSAENDQLVVLPSSNGTLASATESFFAPANASSVTVYHLINGNGSLTTGNFSLELTTPASQNLFPQGIVSLSFDDGWQSQYDNALPILQAAGLPATFNIITDTMTAGGEPLFSNFSPESQTNVTVNCDGTVGDFCATTSTLGATWNNIYTDPLGHSFTLTDSYSSTATSTVTVTYSTSVGSSTTQTIQTLATLASTAGVAKTFQQTFTLPTLASSSPISISQKSTNGSTAITSASLIENGETNAAGYLTEPEVQAMQTDGEEIGAHTLDHCDLAMLDTDPNSATEGGDLGPPAGACASALSAPSTAAQQIDGSRAALLSAGLSPVNTFAYPYGDYDSNVENLLKQDGFTAARTSNAGYNYLTSDPFALNMEVIDASTTFETNGLQSIESLIDAAESNHAWLILLMHQVEPSSTIDTNNDIDGTTPDFLQGVVNYLKSNNDTVMTTGAVMAKYYNAVSDPSAPLVPVATPAAGTFTTAQTVSLFSQNALTVHYTINNTAASCSTGTLYASPIAIATSTDINAIGCNAAGQSSDVSLNYTLPTVPSSTPSSTLATISIAPATLPNGTVSSTYDRLLTASTTASGTFTWSIASGTLPLGLHLNTASTNTTTTISGTPTASGTSTFSIMVANGTASSSIASSTQAYTITIAPMAISTSTPTSTTPTSTPPTPSSTIPVITISTASPLPDGTAGAAYDQFIAATSTVAGNTLTWSVATGTLPDGLNLNTATGELSGTPGTQNTFSFAITVANGSANASTTASSTQNYTLTIDPAPVVVITPPAPPTGGSTSGGGSVTSGGGGGGGGGGSFYTPLPTASTSTTSGNVGGGVVLGASTTNELALLQSLMAQLVSLEQQLVTMNFKQNSCPATFTENLSQGMTDPQVQNLQKVLNYTSLTQVAQTGAGSPGNESTYFGSATKAAVIAFQNIFAAQILAPNGLTAGNGYVGAATRNELNQLCSQ